MARGNETGAFSRWSRRAGQSEGKSQCGNLRNVFSMLTFVYLLYANRVSKPHPQHLLGPSTLVGCTCRAVSSCSSGTGSRILRHAMILKVVAVGFLIWETVARQEQWIMIQSN